MTDYAGDVDGMNYCYEDVGNVQYIPGDPGPRMEGLLLSKGLTARLIATAGERVRLHNEQLSGDEFHDDPDGAAVFAADDGSGQWRYVSNSEQSASETGGVGAITFDADGNVIGYERLLQGQTNRNCGGGKTYWYVRESSAFSL